MRIAPMFLLMVAACQPGPAPRDPSIDATPAPQLDTGRSDSNDAHLRDAAPMDRYLPPLLDGSRTPADARPDQMAAGDASNIDAGRVIDGGLSPLDTALRDGGSGAPDVEPSISDATIDVGAPVDQGPTDLHPPVADRELPDAPLGPSCGNGRVEDGEDCDDGDALPTARCTEECRFNQPCPPLAGQCRDRDNWVPGLRQHHMVSTDACVFGMDAPSPQDWAAGNARIEALTVRLGASLDISEVLGDLNRVGQDSVTNQTALRLRNHEFFGFVWNDGDMAVDYWYPQGITGSSDARANHVVNGRRLIMVSWYHRTNERPTKGARISLADITDPNRIRYRHLLLAEPIQTAAGVDYRAVRYDHGDQDALHAGGIVWLGPYLYVADTRVGLRVFDLTRIMRMSHTDDRDRIGIANDRSYAHGYRYIVPQLARYALSQDSCPLSFSAVALDRSTDPPTLLTSEYRADDTQSRLVHWAVDPATSRLLDFDGAVRSRSAQMAAQTRVQGALSWEGNYYISSSSQFARFGRLYRTRPGRESSISAWVYGCEDLYYERNTGLIWTAAEFPDFRDVVGIPLRAP